MNHQCLKEIYITYLTRKDVDLWQDGPYIYSVCEVDERDRVQVEADRFVCHKYMIVRDVLFLLGVSFGPSKNRRYWRTNECRS